jgi:hypothetical protein
MPEELFDMHFKHYTWSQWPVFGVFWLQGLRINDPTLRILFAHGYLSLEILENVVKTWIEELEVMCFIKLITDSNDSLI